MSIHAVQVKGRFYILKDIIKDGKHSTATVKKLGTAEDIMAAYGCDDAREWAKQHALELDMKDRESRDPEGRHFILGPGPHLLTPDLQPDPFPGVETEDDRTLKTAL